MDHRIVELQRHIEGIAVAMVTTIAADGVLRSRPMLVERLQPDATLVFLTHLSSAKVGDIGHDRRVNVAFQSDEGDRYVSVSGTATIVHDEDRFREMWNPTYRAWFPGGPDDPDSAILTIAIERADCWDVTTSRMVRVWSAVKALATGEVIDSAERTTFDFPTRHGADGERT
jgi:general stress protein 26